MAEEPRECDCESVLGLLHEFADAVAAEGQCRERQLQADKRRSVMVDAGS